MGQWPQSLGVVGCGAMGRAMAEGILRSGHLTSTIWFDVHAPTAEAAQSANGGTVGTLGDAAQCDLLLVAVKPAHAGEAVAALAAAGVGANTVVMSVITGYSLDQFESDLPRTPAVRTMPNLAVRNGAGSVAFAARGLSEEQRAGVDAALSDVGAVIEMPESMFASATALIGSGPGFVCLMAEALEDGAVAVGFPRAQARILVQSVLAGTASLLAGGDDPADVRQRVSSPGGTTITGLGVLERGAVRGHIADAVRAAAERAKEL